MKHSIEIALIDQLRAFPGNPKDITDEEKAKLKKGIRKHGLLKSLSVWKKGTENKPKYIVLDGNQRLEVLKEICEEDGNKLIEIPVEPVECKDDADAMDKCLSLVGQYGRLNRSKLKKAVVKAGYKGLAEAQGVFSFVELDSQSEESEEDHVADETEAPATTKWAGAKVAQSPTDGVFFYVKDHTVKEGFTKEDIWDEQQQ